ncbi:hypothetical protein Tco_1055598 [Tanacetum coccineum]|uniref:Retrovirus-related Pol polyprotein from transposon TNT 1-94-like beta-barrel domain-containing protein n=1 Tax=Tanacetum coccineum TaxID=301880 RepID=A0ABQ5H054_9ASTR
MVIKKLKKRIKSISGNMDKDKIKQDLEEIETINIELDHRVTKLIAENEHLKQTYKQLYDSIKPARIQSKEQCAKLINMLRIIQREKFGTQQGKVVYQDWIYPGDLLVVQIVLWYLDSGCSKHMTGDRSQLTNFVNKFLGTVKFGNDHVAKIMGYGDYQIGNVTILRVYYVKGLGHNLFSVDNFLILTAKARAQRKPTNPNLEDTNQEKTLYVDWICATNAVASVNGKEVHPCYCRQITLDLMVTILAIKDEAQRLKLREYYEKDCISHETSVARSPHQTSVDESRNRTQFNAAALLDTLMVEKSKLDEDKEGKVVDLSHYCGMIGTLLYLRASFADSITCRNQQGGRVDVYLLVSLPSFKVRFLLSFEGDAKTTSPPTHMKVEATLKIAWIEKDQIDNLLKERRLMRRLEKFFVMDRARYAQPLPSYQVLSTVTCFNSQEIALISMTFSLRVSFDIDNGEHPSDFIHNEDGNPAWANIKQAHGRFYTSAGNPVNEILLKLNLPDHRKLKDGGEVKEFQRSFRHSDTERLSRSDEVLKLKNFKKDATLKLFKSTNQERYEHVGPEVTSSQDGKVTRWQKEIMFG